VERLRYLLNKFGHIYNEEEAIEVQFRHIMLDKKVPKDIGYNEEQKDEYIGIYEELNSKIITETEAIKKLTYLMEKYYGFELKFK